MTAAGAGHSRTNEERARVPAARPPGRARPTPDRDDLDERAKDYVEHLPADTALGNADPAGGDQTDPDAFEKAAEETRGE